MSKSIENELMRLPLRAVVAFASRCARRVQPLAEILPKNDQIDIGRAIAASELFAADSREVDGPALSAALTDADDVAARGIVGDRRANSARAIEVAAYSSLAAADAARSAVEANAARGDTKSAAARSAAARASQSVLAAIRATDNPSSALMAVAAAEDDIDCLINMELGRPDTLGQPIDPSESGPLGSLWPNGEPDWHRNPPQPITVIAAPVTVIAARIDFVAPTPPPDGLLLEAFVGEFADTEEVAEALANLGYALNAFHVEAGGNGLVIDDWRICVPSHEPAEVE